MTDLPPGWTEASVREIASSLVDGPFGSNLKSEHYQTSGVRVIRLQNISDGRFDDRDKAYISLDHFNKLNRHEARPGDVLIAALGDVLPRACLVPPDIDRAIVKADCFRLRPHKGVSASYLVYILSAPQIRKRASTEIAGVGRPRLNLRKVSSLVIPVPPSTEQERIVAAIEEQFSRLDAGLSALERAGQNLKRMRAALLQAAVTGQLVPNSDEDVAGILDYISIERRAAWRAATNKPYREPADPTAFPLAIPKHWRIASLEAITDPIRVICYGILMPKEHIKDGVPYVRVKDMKGWMIDVAGLNRTSPEIAAKYARASLRAGDLLLAIRGSYGRVAIIPSELHGGNITQDSARIAPHPTIDRRYLLYYLGGSVAHNYYARVARGVAVKGVNIGDLRSMPIPIPPRQEQEAIADEIERQFTLLNSAEAAVRTQHRHSQSLRSSILAAAFSGRLVPQDPTDEPAPDLVARIAEERTSSNNHSHRRVRTRTMQVSPAEART